MAQQPPQGDWPGWAAGPQPQPYPYPYPQQVGFDPADPLVSNDLNGWWRRGFGLVKAAWRPMAVVQAIIAVPTLALMLPTTLFFQERQRVALEQMQAATDAGARPDFTLFFSGLSVLLPVAVVAGLLSMLGQLANQQVVALTATGRTGNLVGPAFLAAARRLPALTGWCLVALPVLIVAMVLCFFPVLYVSAVLAVLPAVVLFERGNGIGRCFRLFHAAIGVSLSRIATLLGLAFGTGAALTMLTLLVDVTIGGSFETPGTAATVINSVLQTGYSAVCYVVLAPLLVTAYADMRARHEPFSTANLLPGQA